MNNASNPIQPIGYINDRLTEQTVKANFKSAQVRAWIVDPSNPTECGHPEFMGGKVTKRDQITAAAGDIVCYERTVNGYDTMDDLQSGDTAWIVDEVATQCLMKLTTTENGPVWVHIPNHKVIEAEGNPYNVQYGYNNKQGRYLPC